LIIVAADNAVLIASQDHVSEIKTLLRSMGEQGLADTRLTSFSHRPWGSFYGVDRGERYQVKRLVLKPGGKISLQTHVHRAEHWVVVKGIATITNGNTLMQLNENESTYIPAGALHRLENLHDDDLIVIEVQTGTYLGEDDIERFDDLYQRV
jgi:mannose-6-phosphate isomerase-like protein (cupin superfamily)